MTESKNSQDESAFISPLPIETRPAPLPAVAPKQTSPTREIKRPPALPMAPLPASLRPEETVPATSAAGGESSKAEVSPAKSVRPFGKTDAGKALNSAGLAPKEPRLNQSAGVPRVAMRASSDSPVGPEPVSSPTGFTPPPSKPPLAVAPASPAPVPGKGPHTAVPRETAKNGLPNRSGIPTRRPDSVQSPATAVAGVPALPVAKPLSPGLVESVPMPFCWALLGVSALVLIIQLWTYFS